MNTSSPASKKDQLDKGIAIVVVLIAMGFILYQGLYTHSGEPSVMGQLSSDLTAINDRSPVTVAEVTYLPIPVALDDRSVVRPQAIAAITPVAISQSRMTTVPASVDTTLDSLSAASITVVDSAAVESVAVDTSNGSKVDSMGMPTRDADTIDVASPMVESGKDCIIIIGAFSSKSNVDRLLQNLTEDGHRPFTTPYEGMTRVGVYTSCDNTILYNRLRSISKKYAADAFALKNQ